MIAMQEPTKTIVELLQNNWNDDCGVAKSTIQFRRGEPLNLLDRFRQREITVEVCKLTKPTEQRTISSVKVTEIVAVNVWMIIRPKSDEQIATLLDKRQVIEDEIERILLANNRSATNINFVMLDDTRYMDDYESEPPVLHAVKHVACIYVKGA